MRILCYEEGQQFKPHVDGVDYMTSGPRGGVCCSRLTLALYLNKQEDGGGVESVADAHTDTDTDTHTATDTATATATATAKSLSDAGGKAGSYTSGTGSYTGGAFRFLLPPEVYPREEVASRPHCTIASSKLALSASDAPLIPVYPHHPHGGLEVCPDEGRVILFGQEEYHEGLPVYGGCKYMIQTSVMYELVPECENEVFEKQSTSSDRLLDLRVGANNVLEENDEEYNSDKT
jgi:hypothetical protein